MKKVYKTVISLILAISVLSVNIVALAATGDADTYAGYLKSGWSWSASSNTLNYPTGGSGTWNKALIDVITDITPYKSGWAIFDNNTTPNVPSGFSGSWYEAVLKGLNFIERNTESFSFLKSDWNYYHSGSYAPTAGNGSFFKAVLDGLTDISKYTDYSWSRLTQISENMLTYYNGLITRINAANTDITSAVNSFASANHSDVTSFASANHTDITGFASANHTDITSFASANHTDLDNIYTSVGAKTTKNRTIISNTNDLSNVVRYLSGPWSNAYDEEGYWSNPFNSSGIITDSVNWFATVLNMLQSASGLSYGVSVDSNGYFGAGTEGDIIEPRVSGDSPFSRVYRELWLNSSDNGSKWDVVNASESTDNSTNVYRNILYDVGMLKRVLATEEDLELRNQQSDNVTAVTDNFLTGQSSGSSVGSADFSGISDGLGSVTGLFASPVGISSTSDAVNGAFSSQFGLRFFTSDCSNDLDTVGAGNRRLRSSKNDGGNEIVTHYYEDNQSAVNEWLEAHLDDKSAD